MRHAEISLTCTKLRGCELQYKVDKSGIPLSSNVVDTMVSRSKQQSNNGRLLYGSELKEGYIRLIRLLPSRNAHGVIRCSLFEVSLTDSPEWEALSYTWGDAHSQRTILINGIKTPIRKNLCDSLSHLRGPEERILWFDSICINQKNVPECNHQVKQMKRIYESASRVIIWLDLKYDSSAWP